MKAAPDATLILPAAAGCGCWARTGAAAAAKRRATAQVRPAVVPPRIDLGRARVAIVGTRRDGKTSWSREVEGIQACFSARIPPPSRGGRQLFHMSVRPLQILPADRPTL